MHHAYNISKKNLPDARIHRSFLSVASRFKMNLNLNQIDR